MALDKLPKHEQTCDRCDSYQSMRCNECYEHSYWIESVLSVYERANVRITELEARVLEDNAVCICGCPAEEHESLGEDWEQCEHEDHICLRVAPAVRDMFVEMREHIKKIEQELSDEKAKNQELHDELSGYPTALEQMRIERDDARRFGENAAQKYNELLLANQTVTCAFCGQEYPRGTPRHGDGALSYHIAVCSEHPMRKLEKERDALKNRIAELETVEHAAQDSLASADDVIADLRESARKFETRIRELEASLQIIVNRPLQCSVGDPRGFQGEDSCSVMHASARAALKPRRA